jgi:hypothetical protein
VLAADVAAAAGLAGHHAEAARQVLQYNSSAIQFDGSRTLKTHQGFQKGLTSSYSASGYSFGSAPSGSSPSTCGGGGGRRSKLLLDDATGKTSPGDAKIDIFAWGMLRACWVVTCRRPARYLFPQSSKFRVVPSPAQLQENDSSIPLRRANLLEMREHGGARRDFLLRAQGPYNSIGGVFRGKSTPVRTGDTDVA